MRQSKQTKPSSADIWRMYPPFGRDCWSRIDGHRSRLMPTIRGLENVKKLSAAYFGALSERRLIVEEMIGEGNNVTASWTISLTAKTPLSLSDGTVLPTGKTITFTGISIFRLRGGKVLEELTYEDVMSWIKQAQEARGWPTARDHAPVWNEWWKLSRWRSPFNSSKLTTERVLNFVSPIFQKVSSPDGELACILNVIARKRDIKPCTLGHSIGRSGKIKRRWSETKK